MRTPLRPIRPWGGFTLVELLVVIAIIALISAAALPVVLPALNQRRVSEAARILQAGLVGTRDAAIRANAPRGIRLLPDPVFGFNGNIGGGPLASNRFVPIEPAPDYSEGTVNGWIDAVTVDPTVKAPTGLYYPGISDANNHQAVYLRIQSNEVYSPPLPSTPPGGTPPTAIKIPQIPTGWAFNIRQGDQIRFGDSGAYYTVAGPIHGLPITKNPERYICFKSATDEANYHGDPTGVINTTLPLEYLNLLNGVDDNGNGWVDEQCDGKDNDGDGITDPGFNGLDDNNNGVIDEPAELFIGLNSSGVQTANAGSEYEIEKYLGMQTSSPPNNADYTILRQSVVSPNAIETVLPAGSVVDLTTWNALAARIKSGAGAAAGTAAPSLPERSRLPVNPFSGYVDVMIDQSGRVVPPGAGSGTSTYSASSPLASLPFYHFWIAEREDVVAPLFGSQQITIAGSSNQAATPFQVPNANPNYGATATSQNYLLPMPQAFGTVDGNSQPVALKGERRLVTLFTKTGQIVANSIENFSVNDTSFPYYDAQNGTKESL